MYLLNTGNLLPGDIVLTAQDAKVSRKIRKHTKSDFSHALLYVSHSSYIHSDLNGVHSGNTQRLLFHDLAHAIVLRVSSPEHRNRIAMACEFARSQVGKQYSVVEAAKSLGNRKISAQTKANRQFCSRLVAQSFAYANIPLVVNPDYCYPEDLHNPEYVAPIESPLRLATSFEIEFANSPSPLDLQRNITNDIIAMARKLSGEDIQTEEEIVDAILRQQQIDKPLTEFVRNSGYFDLWKIDVENNRWRYDVLHFRALSVSREQKFLAAEREAADAAVDVDRFRRMLGIYMYLRQMSPRHYFDAHIKLYEDLVRLHTTRLAVSHAVLSDA